MELHGSRNATGCRFAIVVSRFNEEVTAGLLRGAHGALAEAGVLEDDITLVRVPGAFEIPLAARRLAASGRVDAVICLGCLIKGETMHFEYIASAVGVLTALTEGQAVARAGEGESNKGREAALAAVEMATLGRRLSQGTGHDG
jgi:6,7-dimethyl-8-ribityllumazine synthase